MAKWVQATLKTITAATANPVPAAGSAFSETVLLDSDCDGAPDVGDGPLAASIAVAQGQKICFLVKEFVPKTVPFGTQNAITVSANMTLSLTGTTYTLTRSDSTVVSSSNDAVLSKLVRNVTTATGFTTSNTASPNDVIDYQVSIFNPSTGPVTAVVVSDTTPAYTLFVSAACPGALPTGITSCAATAPAKRARFSSSSPDRWPAARRWRRPSRCGCSRSLTNDRHIASDEDAP